MIEIEGNLYWYWI